MDLPDEYAQWAESYDKYGALTNILASEQDFLKKVVYKYRIQTVLDCACGTGPHLIFLARMGLNVRGSDYSEAMLTICHRNLARKGLKVTTKAADYRYLEKAWGRKFDAILCMNQSIAHMLTREDLLTAFNSIRGRLNDKGILVMTQGTTHLTLQDKYRFDLIVNHNNFSRVFVRDVEDGMQIFHYLDIYHSSRRDEMETHSVRLKIILDDEYRSLLSQAGFSRVHLYGGLDMAPYDREKSRRLIVVAEK